ncbi:polysaccharide deacetylase family protein [Thiocystis minor]|uniref:polysaccharide deacetylase family protein n=1 Tax=Thiocystis minor TaxID=61597 RepID=UPI0019137ADE
MNQTKMNTNSGDKKSKKNNRATHQIKRMIGRVLLGVPIKRIVTSNHVWIAAFHRVDNLEYPDQLTCGIEAFADYCKFFAHAFRVVPLSQQLDELGRKSSGGTLSITFDDGYRDNFENAAPILERFGLPATFFVASGFIGTNDVAWWDEALPKTPGWMDWNQVRSLRTRGFEIGCHTVTHADLGQISSASALDEVTQARQRLQTELGIDIDLFAYPYGGRNNLSSDNRAIVKEAGFRCCLSCHGGVNSINSDPFYLRRIPVNSYRGETADDIAYHFIWNLAHRNSL